MGIGYMNNKSETQILKVSNKEVKKCYQCDGNQAAKSCPFIYSVFIVTTKVIQVTFVIKRQKQLKWKWAILLNEGRFHRGRWWWILWYL